MVGTQDLEEVRLGVSERESKAYGDMETSPE